jgi:hypothetical protein
MLRLEMTAIGELPVFVGNLFLEKLCFSTHDLKRLLKRGTRIALLEVNPHLRKVRLDIAV